MKNLKVVLLLAVSLFISQNLTSSAEQVNNTKVQNIAVIDIQKVVSASSQVKALKTAQEAKNKELKNFIQKAQADVNKQKDEKAKKAAAEKYEKQLVEKRNANMKEYSAKLQATEKSISEQIGKKANELGYSIVLPKASVVYGGDDITEAVLKVIK